MNTVFTWAVLLYYLLLNLLIKANPARKRFLHLNRRPFLIKFPLEGKLFPQTADIRQAITHCIFLTIVRKCLILFFFHNS